MGGSTAIKRIDWEKMLDFVLLLFSGEDLVCSYNILLATMLQVLASRTKIYIILEYITGGELFDKIVSSLHSVSTAIDCTGHVYHAESIYSYKSISHCSEVMPFFPCFTPKGKHANILGERM